MINVIFDMDGTLLNSEDCICAAIAEIRHDKQLPALSKEVIQQAIHTPGVDCAKFFMGFLISRIEAIKSVLKLILKSIMREERYYLRVCVKCFKFARQKIIF